jgi:hypothetical protein
MAKTICTSTENHKSTCPSRDTSKIYVLQVRSEREVFCLIKEWDLGLAVWPTDLVTTKRGYGVNVLRNL